MEHIVINPEETVDSISDDFQIQDKEVEAGKDRQSLCFVFSFQCLKLTSF